MKIEKIKSNGKTVGYNLIPETEEEQLTLNEIRNLHYFGMNETAIRYNGMESEKKDGKEMVTKLFFIQQQYHRDNFNNDKLVTELIPGYTEFLNLKRECFGIVLGELEKQYGECQITLSLVVLIHQHSLFPPAPLIIDTYKGIIGFYHWTIENVRNTSIFLATALHDLSECINYKRNDGYCPRTESYIKYYKK